MMNICVIGTGYVGLVVGACFADMGNEVRCVDVDADKIAKLRKGKIPIFEPELEDVVKRNVLEKRLTFTTDLASAVKKSLICFIAVGTPPGEDGSADLKHVLDAAKGIAAAMNDYKIIVNKSTVPVGTADKVRAAMRKVTTHPFDVVSNPEFLKEGAAVADFMRPSRIIIGTNSPKAEHALKELYSPFNRTGKPILVMSNASAEIAKYAANAMLATRISFMNEIANLAEAVGADIEEVRNALASDPRIGNKFLFAGVGYGGSCFPKDVKAIIHTAHQHHRPLLVMEAVQAANERQKKVLQEKMQTHFNHQLKGKRIAIWGLAFKPNTDDIREAPSLTLIEFLLRHHASVSVFDPAAMEETKKIFTNKLKYCKNSYEALAEADALVILTEWNEFRYPDFTKLSTLMRHPVIFDGRNIYSEEMLKGYRIDAYYSIERTTRL